MANKKRQDRAKRRATAADATYKFKFGHRVFWPGRGVMLVQGDSPAIQAVVPIPSRHSHSQLQPPTVSTTSHILHLNNQQGLHKTPAPILPGLTSLIPQPLLPLSENKRIILFPLDPNLRKGKAHTTDTEFSDVIAAPTKLEFEEAIKVLKQPPKLPDGDLTIWKTEMERLVSSSDLREVARAIGLSSNFGDFEHDLAPIAAKAFRILTTVQANLDGKFLTSDGKIGRFEHSFEDAWKKLVKRVTPSQNHETIIGLIENGFGKGASLTDIADKIDEQLSGRNHPDTPDLQTEEPELKAKAMAIEKAKPIPSLQAKTPSTPPSQSKADLAEKQLDIIKQTAEKVRDTHVMLTERMIAVDRLAALGGDQHIRFRTAFLLLNTFKQASGAEDIVSTINDLDPPAKGPVEPSTLRKQLEVAVNDTLRALKANPSNDNGALQRHLSGINLKRFKFD